jgi:hypothetical protein
MTYICQYGNCEETEVRVTVTHKFGGTERFCSDLHAAASILHRAFRSIPTDAERISVYLIVKPLIDHVDSQIKRSYGKEAAR